MAVVIRMPEVLAGTEEAVLVSWLVQPGEDITIGQPLAEIETDKAVVEYAAEVAGALAGTLVGAGTRTQVGTPIAVLAENAESVEDALAAADSSLAGGVADVEAAAPSIEDAQPPVPAGSTAEVRLFASPVVRWIASQNGIDLSTINGTGPNGRIVRRDIEKLAPPAPQPPADEPPLAEVVDKVEPSVQQATSRPYTDVPHSGMRRAIARRLTESKGTIPHFYLRADCRVDALLDLRRQINEQSNARISVNDFVIKAVAVAFREVPEANAIWTEKAVRRFENVDVAVAVSVADGLLTPVVEAVDQHSLGDVSARIRDLAARARDGKIRQEEIEGGSFTVSNLGMHGISEFAAIINPPHSGILAVGAAGQRPVVIDGQLAVATVMTVTLSADHRVLDGALAASWLAAFVKAIENPLTILL